MLRTRGHYDCEAMLHQFKSHIWGHTEYANGCISHAVRSQLERLNSMQRGYLHGLQLNEEIAFIQYNFVPPTLRRDIGMLGLIHKRVLGLAHPDHSFLLPWAPPSWYTSRFRPRHNKQITNMRSAVIFNHGLFNRSIFGMVDVYNRLPQEFIDCQTIAEFQKELTTIAKRRCLNGVTHWKHSFSSTHPDSYAYSPA